MTTFRFVPLAFGGALAIFAATLVAEPTSALSARRAAGGLVVTTTADTASPCTSGKTSLRCAIDQANADGSGDTIAFAIPASDKGCKKMTLQGSRVSVCTIEENASQGGLVLSASGTTINGYSQAGARANTGATGSGFGDNAILTVHLDGTSASGAQDGLTIAGNSDGVSGLVVTGFSAGAGVKVTGATDAVAGNFIGVAPDGKTAAPNGTGLVVTGTQATVGGQMPALVNVVSGNAGVGISLQRPSLGATVQGNLVGVDLSGGIGVGNGSHGLSILASNRNMIGAAAFAARNVFSGNGSSGISIARSSHTVVQGNLIGTDVTGNRAIGNGRDGSAGLMLSTRNSHDGDNLIGGTILGTINVISGNLADGIVLDSGNPKLTNGNVIEGNAIGSMPDGKSGLPNAGNGIFVMHNVNGAEIGGNAQSTGNLIAFNAKSGILIGASPADRNDHVAVDQNTMFQNGGLGIDLSPQNVVDCATAPPGPNDYVPCPVITIAQTTTASGTACPNCHIEVYFATGESNDLGHGEAQEFLGTTTASADGNWKAIYTVGKLRAGDLVTATATRPATKTVGAETSEYAANVAASGSRLRRLR